MVRFGWVVGLALLVLWVSPAAANVLCVQQGLTQLGYPTGTPDGAIGGKTRSAARAFATATGVEGLPELTATTSPEWCVAIKRAIHGGDVAGLRSVNGIYPFDLDVTSPPDDLLSQQQLDTFWNMHKTATECLFVLPGVNNLQPITLPKLPAVAFALPPEPLFPVKPANRACLVTEPLTARLGEVPRSSAPPTPFTGFDEETRDHFANVYGLHPNEDIVDFAGLWFAATTTRDTLQPDAGYDRQLIEQLLAWAKAGAFQDNVQYRGNDGPVIIPVTTTMATLIHAYVSAAPAMTEAERGVVGPWLRGILQKIGDYPEDRFGNHAAGFMLLFINWGLATGDANLIQWSIENYKRAIHDMRPDGTFPHDSSRGGMGLSYQGVMTGNLVLVAATLKSALGLDLFDYEVDGRSIHTAVVNNIAAMKDPITFNQRYALPCPNAGDYFGSVDNPNIDWGMENTFATSVYLTAYAVLNPSRSVSPFILSQFSLPTQQAVFDLTLSAPPLCQFGINAAGVPDVDLASLAEPSELVIDESAATRTVEVMAGTIPEGQLHGLLRTTLRGEAAGFDVVTYNISGQYSEDGARLEGLEIVYDQNVGTSKPEGLAKCLSSPGTVQYDNDPHHFPRIEFERRNDVWIPVDAACIADALEARPAHGMRFLASSLPLIAQDMVAAGDVDNLRSKPLQRLMREIADGTVRIAALKDVAETPGDIATQTVEMENFGSEHGGQFRALFQSKVLFGSEPATMSYNIIGNYSGGMLLSFQLIFDQGLGKTPPKGLAECGTSARTEKYDSDQQYYLSLTFRSKALKWTLENADCIVSAIPADQADMVRYLAKSFATIARDMVASGGVDTITNDGLRALIASIADGGIVFSDEV